MTSEFLRDAAGRGRPRLCVRGGHGGLLKVTVLVDPDDWQQQVGGTWNQRLNVGTHSTPKISRWRGSDITESAPWRSWLTPRLFVFVSVNHTHNQTGSDPGSPLSAAPFPRVVEVVWGQLVFRHGRPVITSPVVTGGEKHPAVWLVEPDGSRPVESNYLKTFVSNFI